jgi:hypothetical protein
MLIFICYITEMFWLLRSQLDVIITELSKSNYFTFRCSSFYFFEKGHLLNLKYSSSCALVSAFQTYFGVLVYFTTLFQAL